MKAALVSFFLAALLTASCLVFCGCGEEPAGDGDAATDGALCWMVGRPCVFRE